MKKIVVVLALAALAVVALGATAQAHTLSKQKAATVARSVAQQDCNADPDCIEYGALKNHCKQASPHRVRCYALIAGTDSDGNYGCQRPVLVKLRSRSYKLLYVVGGQQCARFDTGEEPARRAASLD